MLLYKFFNIYITEQDKKWIKIVEKVHKKIKYYKDLCKLVISHGTKESKNLNLLEKLNSILFSNILTIKNLNSHKEMIKELINIINEKRGEIFMMKSEVEIMEKEMKFWIHDFDTLKINTKLREDNSKIDLDVLRKNLDEELKHKK